MRVHVVDPSAYTPPYDDALCSALAASGLDVELYSGPFAHGAVPPPGRYQRHESFYRLSGRIPAARARRLAKLAAHVPDMVRYGRAARMADVVHFQWLPAQPIDALLLRAAAARGRRPPLVLTAHDVLPREPLPGQLAAQRALYRLVDAVVVHSEHGRRRLLEELGLDPQRVHRIPHGVLRPWEHRPPARLPPELPRGAGPPVVLFFGLLRPYKGLDLLLDAWRGLEGSGAELWIVGMPRMDIAQLRASAPSSVRWLARFIDDGELAPLMRRASLLVAPYRAIDQSGVVFTALGAGLPLVLSDVGGFPELERTGAVEIFPAGDGPALAALLRQLLADPARLATMAARARLSDSGELSWASIAQRTRALYEQLLAAQPPAGRKSLGSSPSSS